MGPSKFSFAPPPRILVPQTTLFVGENGTFRGWVWGGVQRGSCIAISMRGGSIPEGVGILACLEEIYWSYNRIDSTSARIRCSPPPGGMNIIAVFAH